MTYRTDNGEQASPGDGSARDRGPSAPVIVIRTLAAGVILMMLFIATWYSSAGTETVTVRVPVAGAGATLPGQVQAQQAAPAAKSAPPSSSAPPPAGGGPAAAVPISPGGGGPAAPAAGTPVGGGTPIGGGTAPGAGAVPGGTTAIDGSGTGGVAGLGAAPIAQQASCPLGWPKPERQGGLASLIGLAPAAGPFSSEAFALGSVYQPLLQLAGPLLAEIEPVITANLPWINPLIEQVQGVEAVVLEAILPYYGPYRGQLLAAEGELAKVLAPILERAYQSPAAACLVAWQGQIISAAKGKPVTVASLSRPGQTIELEG